jgi:hypothetical protein
MHKHFSTSTLLLHGITAFVLVAKKVVANKKEFLCKTFVRAANKFI